MRCRKKYRYSSKVKILEKSTSAQSLRISTLRLPTSAGSIMRNYVKQRKQHCAILTRPITTANDDNNANNNNNNNLDT